MVIDLSSMYGHLDVVNRLLQDSRVDPTVHDHYILNTIIQPQYNRPDIKDLILQWYTSHANPYQYNTGMRYYLFI